MTSTIVMTYADHAGLRELFDRMTPEDRRHFELLRQKLEDARRVAPSKVGANVVTMGSTARLRELDSGDRWTFTLSFPPEANIDEDRISVLSPVGTAMIGCRVGDVVDWPVPSGIVRIRIEKVLYQPEAAGVFDELTADLDRAAEVAV